MNKMKSKHIQEVLNILYDAGFEDYSLTAIDEDDTLNLFHDTNIDTFPSLLVRKKKFQIRGRKGSKYVFRLNTACLGMNNVPYYFDDWHEFTVKDIQYIVERYQNREE